ncbi:MAG: four helix bundle protein [Candidatus Hydrogenedentes bacterium]|nr:four helix bundle protein [Candidatus Hydrogenedentota bacterium]
MPSRGSSASDCSHNSDPAGGPNYSRASRDTQRLLPKRGNYRKLITYRKAEVIFDITYHFCERFLRFPDRTIGQMVQAARSAKQNIVEGSKAGTTSRETEIRLTNVARASFEELLLDYRDFLRVRGHEIWEKDSRKAQHARKMGMKSPLSYEDFREIVETRNADIVANVAICLIFQATYLLDRQLASLGRSFLEEGGFREHMTRERLKARYNRSTNPDKEVEE